ncbi:MAG: serine hydrolase [Saprospiraceae bacterium]|nr:serine hydrolase [Saprospiraceae bacterium]
MKKVLLLFLFSLLCQKLLMAQINFTNSERINFVTADSAIKAGEFGEVHSLLVIQNAQLLFEEYYNGWNKDSLHQLQSATKSVISALLGCALQQNFIADVREKIINYYPSEYFSNNSKDNISIENLLTQQHGLKWKENPWDAPDNNWRNLYATEGNWYKSILETQIDTAPGCKFNYSNAAPVLITGIIQNASKMNIDVFSKKYLFDPLQITNYRFWQANGGPQNNGMGMLFLTSRDMAKIGQLYLQKGKWNDKQIISEKFVKDATSAIVKNVEANGVYSGYDYGYFWWSNPVWRNYTYKKSENVFLARGAGGQNIIVYPNKKMVVVITAWNMQRSNKPQEIFDKYILNK